MAIVTAAVGILAHILYICRDIGVLRVGIGTIRRAAIHRVAGCCHPHGAVVLRREAYGVVTRLGIALGILLRATANVVRVVVCRVVVVATIAVCIYLNGQLKPSRTIGRTHCRLGLGLGLRCWVGIWIGCWVWVGVWCWAWFGLGARFLIDTQRFERTALEQPAVAISIDDNAILVRRSGLQILNLELNHTTDIRGVNLILAIGAKHKAHAVDSAIIRGVDRCAKRSRSLGHTLHAVLNNTATE